MKVTFNGGYYIVKTGKREAHYRADVVKGLKGAHEARIRDMQRELRDLEAIEQYRKENEA